MRKTIIAFAVFAATVVGFTPPMAHAVMPGQAVLVCRANGDGTCN